MITERENYLRTVEFRGPRWMPCTVGFSPATWQKYREELEAMVLRHPLIFGDFDKGSVNYDDLPLSYREGESYTDNWGTLWRNVQSGLEGIPVGHPLEDWSALDTYKLPDPLVWYERGEQPMDWEEITERVRTARSKGKIAWGWGDRFFERLHFLRGYENLMVDFATDAPQLPTLIHLVLEHNLMLIRRFAEMGVDVIGQGDDLGTQTATMVSPRIWRSYLLPGYCAQFEAARQAGAHTYLHSDGHILEIIDDLIEAGLSVINPQIGANGLEGLAEVCKGRICMNLDLDRQGVLPFGSPQDVREHVREAVERLGSPAGGLMLYGECQPNVPLANMESLCQAMEQVQML
jgi:hypothetical protein